MLTVRGTVRYRFSRAVAGKEDCDATTHTRVTASEVPVALHLLMYSAKVQQQLVHMSRQISFARACISLQLHPSISRQNQHPLLHDHHHEIMQECCAPYQSCLIELVLLSLTNAANRGGRSCTPLQFACACTQLQFASSYAQIYRTS